MARPQSLFSTDWSYPSKTRNPPSGYFTSQNSDSVEPSRDFGTWGVFVFYAFAVAIFLAVLWYFNSEQIKAYFDPVKSKAQAFVEQEFE